MWHIQSTTHAFTLDSERKEWTLVQCSQDESTLLFGYLNKAFLCFAAPIKSASMVGTMESVTCDVCRSDIGYKICFQLNPCSHRACVRCFHEIVPAAVFSRCPCLDCRQWISSSTLLEISGAECQSLLSQNSTTDPSIHEAVRNDSVSNERKCSEKPSQPPTNTATVIRAVQEVPHFQPDEQMDPFRHWTMKKPNLYTGFLYVAYRSSKNEASFYKSNFRAFDSTVFMDDNSTDEMVKIFARILHPLLFQRRQHHGHDSSSSQNDEEEGHSSPARLEDPFGDSGDRTLRTPPHEIDNHYRRQDRQHLAMRCMYALSSGRVLTRAEQEEKFERPKEDLKCNKKKNTTTRQETQRLAKELLKVYQASCLSRNSRKTTEEPPSPSTLPSVVHDLRPSQEQGLDLRKGDVPAVFVGKSNLVPPDDNDAETVRNTHSSNRIWANELGLDELHKIDELDGENPASPIVPAILWILSAVFILSK